MSPSIDGPFAGASTDVDYRWTLTGAASADPKDELRSCEFER